MRSFTQNQRGSTNWPFVIVLLALFVFIYMWWDAQDLHEQQITKIDQQEQTVLALRKIANDRGTASTAVAQVVGFGKQLDGNDKLGVLQAVTVDVTGLLPHLQKDGMVKVKVEGGESEVNGTTKELISQSYLTYNRTRRTGDKPEAAAKDYAYKTMTKELKDKVAQLADFEVPASPPQPLDPDDTADQARYEQEAAAYEQAIAEWDQMFQDAAKMDGFKEYMDTITRYTITEADKDELVKVTFMTALPDLTVEAFLAAVKGVPGKIRKEFAGEKQADTAARMGLAKILAENQVQIDKLNAELGSTSEQFINDLSAKDTQIETLQQQVSDATLSKQTAENALTAGNNTHAKAVAKLDSELSARKEALRLVKAVRDLKIRRDDKDGEIVAASNNLRTATINLGFADKVWIGQRFRVSALDKVGARVAKGEVMVTRVTGQKSARVRITSSTGLITGGDLIHNPFYSPGEEIHVFFAGAITKWPASMAKQRLAAMNVVLQDGINGHTDYIVIPNAWIVAAQSSGDEDDEDSEETVGAKSPIEIMQAHARKAGAEVITESLFNAFLNY